MFNAMTILGPILLITSDSEISYKESHLPLVPASFQPCL